MSYRFDQGETILLALDALEGDVTQVTGIVAELQALGQAVAPIPFQVEPRPAAGSTPAGWNLTIAAAVCADLAPGAYRAAARFQLGEAVIIADPARVRIRAA